MTALSGVKLSDVVILYIEDVDLNMHVTHWTKKCWVILYIEDVDLNFERRETAHDSAWVILYIEDVDLNLLAPSGTVPENLSSSTLRMWI